MLEVVGGGVGFEKGDVFMCEEDCGGEGLGLGRRRKRMKMMI